MADTKTTKMLQAIISGQSAIKEELKGEIQKNRVAIEKNKEAIKQLDEKLTKRIDTLGLQLAQLSDDVPTVGEVDELEERVTKLEQQVISK